MYLHLAGFPSGSQTHRLPLSTRTTTTIRLAYKLVLAASLLAALLFVLLPSYLTPTPSPQPRRSPSSQNSAPTALEMAAPLKHLRMASKDAHTATVIFLHGLGDTGHGWLPVAKMLWGQLPHVKWILPHAPTIPITVNNGYRMPGWFDVITFDRSVSPRPEDEAGILATVEAVDALIQAEVDAGIPENRIVLGGFSQGGAIAVLSQLLGKRKLAGYVSLSTWVPLAHKVEGMARKDAKDYPLFWGHGRDDEIVQYDYGRQSIDLLKRLGFPEVPEGKAFARPGLVFKSYPGMGHSACNEEIADLAAWLTECLKSEGAN